jgi:hypothetical protein
MNFRRSIMALHAWTLLACASACGGPSESDTPAPSDLANATLPAPDEKPAAPVASPPATSAPAPAASEVATERAWAEARGVTFPPGRTVVIAKRRGADARSEVYQDEMLVFRQDGTLERFVATTKPAQMPNPDGTVPDVDGNYRRDLGITRPGVYEAKGNETFGLEGHERRAFRVLTQDGSGALPAWRDTSGDGVFSAREKATSEARKHVITGVLIHYGFAPSGTKLGADTYVGPWSIGCQNVPYAELDRFVEAVGGASASFRYAIVQD